MTDTDTTTEKLDQSVSIEDAGPACKKITIEVPEARIKDKTSELYDSLQDDAALPGFRRGRAPRRLIEKRFSDTIGEDVKNQLISESYTQVIEENEFDVIGNPEVEGIADLKLPESGPLSITVEVEVTPDVALPDFSELKIEKPAADVSDDDIQAEIDKARERFGTLNATDEAVQEDDYVFCAVVIKAGKDAGDDAEVLADIPETYALVHGEKHDHKGHVAGILVPNLGKELIGKKAEDVVTISMTGPSAHENEQIRDADITLVIDMKRVERVEPAPMDTLYQQLGVADDEELNLRVKTYLEDQAERKQQAEMHKQASEQLIEKVELELPEKLSSRQAERTLYRQAMEWAYQGMQGAELEQRVAEARGATEEQAKAQLKQFFVLDKAAKDLEIDVTEQELNGRIAMLAMQQNRRPEKLRQEMQQQGQIEQLYLSIREQKTLAAICEKATITDA